MAEFEENFGEEFFIIDTHNISSIKQNFYGFSIQNGNIIQNDTIDYSEDVESFGAYVLINVDDEYLTISQDYVGSYGLYIYTLGDYFAISNSFLKLVEYLKNLKQMSFNKNFADAFLFAPMTSLSYDKTLVNEIRLIPRDCKILINKTEKKVSYEKVDYEEESVPLNSKEGIELLDNWYWKWVDVVRSLKSKTNYLEMDLSGGFDTRVVAAIWLTANIDLNKIIIRSYTKDVHQEDLKIATKIAEKFNFKLNNNSLRPKYNYFKDLSTTLKLSLYVKFGFHKEMYFKFARFENTQYNFSGSSGGTVRNLYNSTPDEYLNNTIDYIKKFSPEMIDSSKNIINYSFEKIKNKYNLSKDDSYDLTELIYKENNNRHHFGKDLVENYLSNIVKIGPLMDCELSKLKIKSDECDDRDLLMAIIFQRYCPELLEFEVQGNREIKGETLEFAKELNKRYPFVAKTKEFISGPNFDKIDIKATVDRIKVDEPVNYLKNVFCSRLFEMEFKKYYSSDIYQTIFNSIENTGKFSHPLRHAYSAIAILKIINDTKYKSINNFNLNSWLESFLKGEQIKEIPLTIYNLLNKYNTARFDLKNLGNENNSIEVVFNNDFKSNEIRPKWFKNDRGTGVIIESNKSSIDLSLKCICDGLLNISLRSLDIRDRNGQRFPIYIDYINFSVNGEQIIEDNHLTWHDAPYVFKKDVKDSEIVNIHIEWLPFNNSSIYNK